MDIVILGISAKTETLYSGDGTVVETVIVSKTIKVKVVYGDQHKIDMAIETTDPIESFADAKSLVKHLLA